MGRAISYEEIKEYINSKETGNGCKLLTDEKEFKYDREVSKKSNSEVKLAILCKCGESFIVNFNKFKNKKRCNKCSNHVIRTYSDIKKIIEKSGCKLLSKQEEYKNSRSILSLRCSCGNNFFVNFQGFKDLKYKKCNECSKKLSGINSRKTHDQFKKEMYDLVRGEYSILDKYTKSHNKILIRHNCDECNNYEWRIRPENFLKGDRCPKCAGNARKTTEIFKKEVHDTTKGEYTLISEYKNSSSDVKIRHNSKNCNFFEYKVLPLNFYHGDRCPKCSGKLKKTTEMFKKEVHDLTNGEYEIVGKYTNARKHILIKHNVCDRKYMATPTNFLRGKRCPYCSESKAEKLIEHILKKNNIIYSREFIFEDLIGIGGGLLRFDFAIFRDKEKTKLECLIEYDGEFHYKKYYKDQNFESQKVHDKKKNKYCKDNNIRLIRIPYWEFDNIENILDKICKGVD